MRIKERSLLLLLLLERENFLKKFQTGKSFFGGEIQINSPIA